MWICRKVLRVSRNGETILLRPGDEIPEAATWSNRDFWVQRRYVQEIPRPTASNPISIKVEHPGTKKYRNMILTGSEPEAPFDKASRRGKKRNDLELPTA
jgi:hypothetical protein